MALLDLRSTARGSTDADGSVAGFAWDFGDETSVAGGPTSTHTYQYAGIYDVVLTVTDDDGNTASIRFDTVNRQPPGRAGVVVHGALRGGRARRRLFQRVRLVATSTCTITDWAWDFGDGVPVHGRTPTHTFLAPRGRARDPDGHRLTPVRPVPSPTPSLSTGRPPCPSSALHRRPPVCRWPSTAPGPATQTDRLSAITGSSVTGPRAPRCDADAFLPVGGELPGHPHRYRRLGPEQQRHAPGDRGPGGRGHPRAGCHGSGRVDRREARPKPASTPTRSR